jgi:hypothetical protein
LANFPCYDDIVSSLPAAAGLPGVDQIEAATDRLLAADARVTARPCGVSRAGHPLRCLEVGDGPLRAVLLGLPHPDEGIGELVLAHLIAVLLSTDLSERLGFRFSIVRVGDPDGARLNEPWFGRPADLATYVLSAYRPAAGDDPEWSFPVSCKRYAFTRPLPETAAIMSVVDREPTDCFMALHSSSFCGAHFYLSDDDETLRSDLLATIDAAGLPRHLGEPEAPYVERLGEAVYRQFGLSAEYDYLAGCGIDAAAVLESGTSSADYAATAWDAFSLIAEAPLFSTPMIADRGGSGVTRHAARLAGIEREQEHVDWLKARFPEVAARLVAESPWLRAARSYLIAAKTDLKAERARLGGDPTMATEATVAQLVDSVQLRELGALRPLGQFAAMVRADPVAAADPVLAAYADEAEQRARERLPLLAAEAAVEPVPLRRAAQLQLAALLCALDCVRERFRPRRPRRRRAAAANDR